MQGSLSSKSHSGDKWNCKYLRLDGGLNVLLYVDHSIFSDSALDFT